MNQDRVKDILIDLKSSELDFSLIFTGKESGRVNGLYKPDTQEILLHNKNFRTDNQLIYTAVHEYAHHLMNEKRLNQSAGLEHIKGKAHTVEFWATFHELLDIAEEKGVYVFTLDDSPELSELTDNLRKNYIEKNGLLMQEFGKLLLKAHQLCIDSNIRYEDYIDRCLKIPRQAAKSIAKVGSVFIDPSIGYENMKMIASMSSADKRNEAQEQLLGGKSPDEVRFSMNKNALKTNPKEVLEKEKNRLEKSITELTSKLESVENRLSEL